MGSTGTGRFSDYSGSMSGSGGSSNSGGSSGEDICEKAISSAIEEIERCEFFKQFKTVPQVGTAVKVTVDSRIQIISNENLIIGFLPTKYNYLLGCINDGKSYQGIVISTSENPMPSIFVDIAPV